MIALLCFVMAVLAAPFKSKIRALRGAISASRRSEKLGDPAAARHRSASPDRSSLEVLNVKSTPVLRSASARAASWSSVRYTTAPRPALDPLVSSGNPAHRYSSCAKTHRARPRHRMVHLATRTSGRSPQSPHKTESATVMLGFERFASGFRKKVDQQRAGHESQ